MSAVETFDVDLEDGDSSSHRTSVDDNADSAVDDNADSATGHCWHDGFWIDSDGHWHDTDSPAFGDAGYWSDCYLPD